MPVQAFEIADEDRMGTTRLQAGQHRLRLRVARARHEQFARRRGRGDSIHVEGSVESALETGVGEEIDQRCHRFPCT